MKTVEVDPDLRMSELLNLIADSQRVIDAQRLVQAQLLMEFHHIYIEEMGGIDTSGEDYRSLVAEIAIKMKLGEIQSTNLVELARRITRIMPDIGKALEQDHITYEQAKIILDVGFTVSEANRDQFVDIMLTKACGANWVHGVGPDGHTSEDGDRLGLPVPVLRRQSKRLKEELEAETLPARQEIAAEKRFVMVEEVEDGMAWLKLLIPATDAHGIYNGITAAAKQIMPIIEKHPTLFGYTGQKREIPHYGFMSFQNRIDLPTLCQLRADIARDLLLGGNVSPQDFIQHVFSLYEAGQKCRNVYGNIQLNPTIHLTIPVLSLLGADDTPADLQGYGPISIEQAARLCTMAPSFTRILTDPETGIIRSVGRESYRMTANMKKELLARDQHCRWPGCQVPATRSDADHTKAWQHGGATAINNLAHLCRKHHMLKHMGENSAEHHPRKRYRWYVKQRRHGKLEWRSPLGQWVTTVPPAITHTPVLFERNNSTETQARQQLRTNNMRSKQPGNRVYAAQTENTHKPMPQQLSCRLAVHTVLKPKNANKAPNKAAKKAGNKVTVLV